jgi:hypothetical protein
MKYYIIIIHIKAKAEVEMGCNCGGMKKTKRNSVKKSNASRVQKKGTTKQKRMVAIKAINKTLSKKN